jgi:hypothetical protein
MKVDTSWESNKNTLWGIVYTVAIIIGVRTVGGFLGGAIAGAIVGGVQYLVTKKPNE